MTKTIEIRDIKANDHKHQGQTIPGRVSEGEHADIVAGESIRLHGINRNHVNGPQAYDHTFGIGSDAVRDSFNICYIGTITKITAKTVTIENHGRSYRLALATFNDRNRRGIDSARKQNAGWMD